ncbi:MAG: diguanylate cyclase [Candidatus Omnitrophota bacterium]|nr:diguanylate cyclase [Candidatus Omnitrophota bacterium]
MVEKNLSDINVLVIDNDEPARQILNDVLSQEGYKVKTADNQDEGIKMARVLSFQIILSDLMMQDRSSLEVLEDLQAINPPPCIIITTAFPSIKSAVEAMRYGAYDYITKPFDVEELKLTLRRAAERHFLLSEANQKEYYRELSILDGLTGLYNHRYFHEVLTREISRAKRYPQEFSLLMMDIDGFKNYNDQRGHLQGDDLLKQIARVFSQSIRCVDMVFRYGGEEFVILLPQTPGDGAAAVASRIINLIGQKTSVTISIGVATFPQDATTKDSLIDCADKALYQAKVQGKARMCVFDKGINSKE